MKRLLSVVTAVALLVALAALIFLARPIGSNVVAAGAPKMAAAHPPSQAMEPKLATAPAKAAPAAPSVPASLTISEFGLSLDVQQSFAARGLAFTADGMARNMTSTLTSVSQVSHWNVAHQQNDTWDPNSHFGFVNGGQFTTTAFALQTGQAYRRTMAAGAAPVYSIVGSVPAPGAVKFTWTGTGSCAQNSFVVPLDQYPSRSSKDLSDAQKLAVDISGGSMANISQVSRWNATYQQSDTWDPNSHFGFVNGGLFTTAPFSVTIGYSYWICARSGLNGQVWP